jgi:hypothetical protein
MKRYSFHALDSYDWRNLPLDCLGEKGGGGSFINEVKLPVFEKFTVFRFVNKLIGRT